MMSNHSQQLLHFAKSKGLIRSRDLIPLGIPRRVLAELAASGQLERIGRGVYRLPSTAVTENHSLAEAAVRVPSGVITLVSALRFHGLTTQNPWQVWMAISREAQKPRVDYPPIRFVRTPAPSLREGVQTHRIDGVEVAIYSPARTVVDCFRYRNKIGIEVAVEALRLAWKKKKVTADELWRYAQAGRVSRIVRPYLESLAA